MAGAGLFSGDSRYYVYADAWVVSQDAALNGTWVGWGISANKSSGSGVFTSSSGNTWIITGHISASGSGWAPYDFRGSSYHYIASGTTFVAHDADGARTLNLAVEVVDSAGGNLGTANTGLFTIPLPTIPRATLPSFSAGSVDAGSAVTINLPRASASFTHDVTFTFGAASGTIATGAGTSTSWTPDLSLLSQIPNAVSGTALVTVVTKNGATVIGTKTASLTITAGSGIVPDFTAVTHAENVSAIASAIGGYVQGRSKLDLAITGAAGVYGSTITGYRIEVAGQTILAASGTTSEISTSGSLTITATITDSRNRTKVRTASISVLAYAPPAITALQIRRALVGGTLDDDGTYLRVDLAAAVQSLIVGSQKNALQYRISTKTRDTPTWTAGSWVAPGGITFASYDVDVSVPTNESRDVRVEVRDVLLAVSTVQGVLATAAVQLDLPDDYDAIAVGQRYDPSVGGSIQAAGRIYSRADKQVFDAGDIADNATTQAGTSPSTVVTPAGLASLTATDTRRGLAEFATNAETQAASDATRAVTPAGLNSIRGQSGIPFRQAAGRGTSTGSTGSVTTTFPAGRFTQTPIIGMAHRAFVANVQMHTASVSSSALTIYVYNSGSGAGIAGVPVDWTATQMTSGSAEG